MQAGRPHRRGRGGATPPPPPRARAGHRSLTAAPGRLPASSFASRRGRPRAQGITSDANVLVNEARLAAQRHTYVYGEPMPVEQLVQRLCDHKQGYTQFGGQRPFGVSFLFAGWDAVHGFQLYQSDPSGNYGGWKAAAIGANKAAAQSLLKAEHEEGMGLPAALQLAIKVLAKTMDATKLAADKVELTHIALDSAGVPHYHIYNVAELEPLCAAVNAAAAEAEKKPAAATRS